MPPLSPEALAARQLELDRERTRRFPSLLSRKQGRMSASPFAFLRGAAPLFYEILEQVPELADGPAGEGWLAGDLHLENFGAYSPARSAGVDKRAAAFNLNDFDEAVRGPWRLDLLRLLTSLILAGRELGVSGPIALGLGARLLESYVATVFQGTPLPVAPSSVATLVERVASRPRRALLDARTVVSGGKRRFVRGERYLDLPPDVLAALPVALETYVLEVAPEERPRLDQMAIIDAAHRVAGTGSLGVLRVAVLTLGKGAPDGHWIFDLKEQSDPSATSLAGATGLSPAERVLTAFRACVAPLPRLLGTSRLEASELLGRRLTPQEDKLDLRQLKPETLGPLALYLGALVGTAHARGASTKPTVAWSPAEQRELLRSAARMASLHEAVYLEWCLLLQ